MFSRKDNAWIPKTQDIEDRYYKVPKQIVHGCSCKGQCGNRCSCLKDAFRGRTCSRYTCSYCSCFKRVADSEIENLVASKQFQNFMDDLSSSEDESSEEEGEFMEFDDIIEDERSFSDEEF